MKCIRRVVFCIFMISVATVEAEATWSIIVVDPKTKEIGIAGASCTLSVFGIGVVAPGKGAIVVQAASNGLARMQGFNMILHGATARQVMDKIRQADFNPEDQQYAVITMDDIDHPLVYTGTKNHSFNGALTARGIAVQGNTLTHENELKAVLEAALKAQKARLPIHDVLMLALEAGAEAGGDKRCGERKASSAFVIVARPGDVDAYSLKLVQNQTDETSHAVEKLRRQLDDWKKDHPGR